MEVESFRSSSGKDYVGEAILGLPAKAQKKVIKRLNMLNQYGFGFITHSGYVKKLKGYDLYEVKIDFNKISYRILFSIRDTTCWLLNMFIKKRQKTPLNEIDTALQRSKRLDFSMNHAQI